MLHNNGLDRVIVVKTEQELDRSVLRLQLGDFLQPVDSELLVQLGPQALREIAHFFKSAHPLDIQPVENLPAPEGWLAILFSPLGQLFQC
ncbi:hypothetical protein D3C76_1403340 [compost metagenome]